MISDADFRAWLRDRSAQRVVLLEVESLNAAGAVVTEYLATGAYVSLPTDTPPSQPYDDALLGVPRLAQRLADTLLGYAEPSWGDIEVANENGIRNEWLERAWDGRPLRLLLGDRAWSRADFRPILDGVCADIGMRDPAALVLKVRGLRHLLDTPIQTRTVGEPLPAPDLGPLAWRISDSPLTAIDAVFDDGEPVAFTSHAANGYFVLSSAPVGRVTAISRGGEVTTGSPIPLCFGTVAHAEPLLGDAGLHQYLMHDGAIDAVTAVYDNGVTVSATPDLARGRVTLAAMPIGRVTFGARGAKVGGVFLSRIDEIVRHLLVDRAGIPSARIDADSFAAFAAAWPFAVGLIVRERTNILDVVDRLVGSVGGWWGETRAGRIRLGTLAPATGSPVLTLAADDIVARGIMLSKRILPAGEIVVGWGRNYATQENADVAVNESWRAFLRQEWREVRRDNAGIRSRHPTAAALPRIETALANETDAVAVAAALKSRHGVLRSIWKIECYAEPLALDVGDEIAIDHPDLAPGWGGIVVGIEDRADTARATIEVWR